MPAAQAALRAAVSPGAHSLLLKGAGKMVDNVVQHVPGKGIKMTKLGWGMLGAGLAAGAFYDTVDTFEKSRQGQMVGPVERAAPRLPDNAGATGDLVFALNNLRNG